MKKNNQQAPSDREGKKAAGYYDLHTDAVDDLVNAAEENTPHYSQAELEKYRSGKKKWKLPQALKVVLIKTWFYGAVCFFVFWGLGLYVADRLDLYFIAAVIMGMVTDLLINHFLRFTEKMKGGSARWMMVTKRGAPGLMMNIPYGFVLLFFVVTFYSVVNMALISLFGGVEGTIYLGVEPIVFGLAATGADSLLIGCKRTLMKIVSDAKQR